MHRVFFDYRIRGLGDQHQFHKGIKEYRLCQQVNIAASRGIEDLTVVNLVRKDDGKVPLFHMVQMGIDAKLHAPPGDIDHFHRVMEMGRIVYRSEF